MFKSSSCLLYHDWSTLSLSPVVPLLRTMSFAAQQIKDVIKQRFASTNAIGDSCSTSLPSKSTGQRVLFPDDPLQPTSEGGQTKLVLRSVSRFTEHCHYKGCGLYGSSV